MGDEFFLASMVMSLQALSDDELAAASNALGGWGEVPEGCLAYLPLLRLGAIREDGRLTQSAWEAGIAAAVLERCA